MRSSSFKFVGSFSVKLISIKVILVRNCSIGKRQQRYGSSERATPFSLQPPLSYETFNTFFEAKKQQHKYIRLIFTTTAHTHLYIRQIFTKNTYTTEHTHAVFKIIIATAPCKDWYNAVDMQNADI